MFIQAVADSVGGREEVGRLQAVAQGLADLVPGGRGDDLALALGPVIARLDEPDNVGLVGANPRGVGAGFRFSRRAALRGRSRFVNRGQRLEPLSRPELSHRGGCEMEFSCNFPLDLVSTSPAPPAALLRARPSLLHPGDLTIELLAKGNGSFEETQSRH